MPSRFKVGDKVYIVPRVDTQEKYPFWYIDEMTNEQGKIFTISKVYNSKGHENSIFYEEPYSYILKENPYNWCSAMFVIADEYAEDRAKAQVLKLKRKLYSPNTSDKTDSNESNPTEIIFVVKYRISSRPRVNFY